MRIYLLIGLWLLSFPAPAQKHATPEDTVRGLWQNLAQVFTPLKEECPEEYSWLPDRGLRGFYCHVKDTLNYAQLVELAGLPAFRGGPHSRTALHLKSPYDFGHYNPAFVERLHALLLPAKTDPALRAATQQAYDRYLGPLARTVYTVYRELQADPEYLQQQLAAYKDFMAARQAEYFEQDYYSFAGLEKQGFDPYEVASAVQFWLRRHIDGTAALFFTALQDLLMTYDSDFLQVQRKPPLLSSVSVEEALGAVQTVFPEAYTQFMQVSFEYQDSGHIWPAQAHFFVPARHFPAPLDAPALQARADKLAHTLAAADMAVCAGAEIGEEEQSAWTAWPDKNVRKVTVNFGFGC